MKRSHLLVINALVVVAICARWWMGLIVPEGAPGGSLARGASTLISSVAIFFYLWVGHLWEKLGANRHVVAAKNLGAIVVLAGLLTLVNYAVGAADWALELWFVVPLAIADIVYVAAMYFWKRPEASAPASADSDGAAAR